MNVRSKDLSPCFLIRNVAPGVGTYNLHYNQKDHRSPSYRYSIYK